MPESLGEKTEEATPKKLEQARERGQVARSQDLAAAVGLAVGTLLILAYGGTLLETFALMIRLVLQGEIDGDPLSARDAPDAFAESMLRAAVLIAPVFAVTVIAAYVVQFIQVGWLVTAHPIKPDLNKINPVKGVKRLFDTKNMVKTLVNVLKLVFVISVAWGLLAVRLPRLAALPSLEVGGAMWLVGLTVLEVAGALAILLLILAIIDWIFQKWQYKRDQRMTKQEVKEERRSMEGDVETKRRRSRMYSEVARQQVQAGTPTADVIVTNPTHFSVAIRYDGETMNAPAVVSKGADLLAFQIRQIAERCEIPIVERPPLARALYYGTEIGGEIAPEHYAAVAEVLAYVYRLDGKARDGQHAPRGAGAA